MPMHTELSLLSWLLTQYANAHRASLLVMTSRSVLVMQMHTELVFCHDYSLSMRMRTKLVSCHGLLTQYANA